jgi:hypothetical protein
MRLCWGGGERCGDLLGAILERDRIDRVVRVKKSERVEQARREVRSRRGSICEGGCGPVYGR